MQDRIGDGRESPAATPCTLAIGPGPTGKTLGTPATGPDPARTPTGTAAPHATPAGDVAALAATRAGCNARRVALDDFEIVGGTIPGRDHVGAGRLLVGRNNQDAFTWRTDRGSLVAVACDGCGSGAKSEFGAAFAAALVPRLLLAHLPGDGSLGDVPAVLEAVRRDLLGHLRALAELIGAGDDLAEVISEYLLFTIVGTVVAPRETVVFALGDGVWFVNGAGGRIGPFPDNAPPYVAYGLLRPAEGFTVLQRLATRDLDSLLIGTDGAAELAEAAHRTVPGTVERVGPLARFWREDRFFRNPDAVRRRLALLNSPGWRRDPLTGRLAPESALLRDDTTLIALRRRR